MKIPSLKKFNKTLLNNSKFIFNLVTPNHYQTIFLENQIYHNLNQIKKSIAPEILERYSIEFILNLKSGCIIILKHIEKHNNYNQIESFLNSKHELIISTAGFCMEPVIKNNEKILVKKQKPLIGEVGLLEKDGNLIAHRIYDYFKIGTTEYALQGGDNTKSSPILAERILGTVHAVWNGNLKCWEDIERKHISKLDTFKLMIVYLKGIISRQIGRMIKS